MGFDFCLFWLVGLVFCLNCRVLPTIYLVSTWQNEAAIYWETLFRISLLAHGLHLPRLKKKLLENMLLIQSVVVNEGASLDL